MPSPASPDRAAALRGAFRDACALELRALKPGNVHRFAAGHGMTVADFERSAALSAGPLCRTGERVGARILAAVAATRAAVGCNTNLGIILLAAPLIAAAETARPHGLRETLAATLASLDVADADAAYAAIRLADPGGLGRAESEDVAGSPSVTLLEAMTLAANRDRIARQYATAYAEIFAIGVADLAAGAARGIAPEWAASGIYMRFLAMFPDSHVARKFGVARAEDVRAEAARLAARLAGTDDPARLAPPLLAFDAALKERGINPGTSADLTVASLLACAAEHIVNGRG